MMTPSLPMSTRRSSSLPGVLLVLLVPVALCVACDRSQQVRTGPLYVDPDGDQGTANGLFHDMPPVDDRLNAQGGDSEDWRYIIVPTSGRLSLTLNVDDPSMAGNWALHDPKGRVIHSEAFDAARGFYQLPEMPVEPGTYHFQISAAKGGSVYTVGVGYVADPVVASAPVEEPVEEIEEPEEEEDKPRRSSRRDKKPREKKPEKKPEAKDAGDEVVGTNSVSGSITLATEVDGGKVEIVIRGVGKANGVTSGMKGKVKGLGATVKTTSCSSRKCNAVVEGVDARTLREHGEVEFKVP